MSQLPEGWKESPICELAKVQAGVGFPKKFQGMNSGKYPVYKVGDVSRAYLNDKADLSKAAHYVSEGVAKELKGKVFEEGSILFAKIGEALRLNRRVKVSKKGLADNNVMAVTPNSNVDENYLFRFLQYYDVASLSRSTTVPSIRKGDVENIPVPHPKLKEQKGIADKLESILSKLETAQARLDKIPTTLKRFRQSVLAAATTGELTKDWHEVNGLEEWEQVKLKDVGKGFNYGSSSKSQSEGKVPVLRMGNLQSGKLDWKKLVFTSDDKEIEKYKLQPGDVLFNRTNSPELVGKTSIFRGEREAIFAGYLIKVQGTERLNTEYLNIQLNSPHARDYCWAVKTDGVSQSNINAKKLQAYEFELPSIEEQIEIVRVVTELFSNADLVEKQYQAAKLRVDKMTQSILARAFSGKLFSPISEDKRPTVTFKAQNSQSQQTKPEQQETSQSSEKEQEPLQAVDNELAIESNQEQTSEVFKLLKSNRNAMSAQTLFDSLSDNNFNAIDDLFSDLKRLIEIKAVIQVGEGESRTFKVTKK